MKKHPIDDLFARKLTTWEPEPSEAVWQRIQAGQKKKQRRLAGWYWYAAASVALVLVAGYIVWKGQSGAATGLAEGTLAQVQVPAHQVPAAPAQPRATEVLPETGKPANADYPEKAQVPLFKPTQELASQSRVKSDEATPVREPELVLDIEVAKLAREEVPSPAVQTPDLKVPAEPALTEVPPALGQKAESRVIVARVDIDEEENEDPKSSRLIRVLRQLKNAKEGEAVNWNEVGINPRKIMARADERIKNEEEKVSKQYNNLKEKIQL
ncbi:hypothetical protein [Telluribacter sp.]|uniref:hypothetical protein n=1 Tax=Telluribacter sp. TaxID=1978767 RepID=UPI002E14053A|nr:hypothetical protein [Telluribacter sp.]